MSNPNDLILHGYWRSGTSYRTRIALGIKGLSYVHVPVDLRKGEQQDEAFRALNPMGLVPALISGDTVLTQSPAIIEWLDERYPEPPLLPADIDERARVRAMAALVGCDIHPLNNLRVLKALRSEFGADQAVIDAWAGRWITAGFAALDTMIIRWGGEYAYGDTLTIADCYIVPQVYSAERFNVDLSAFPAVVGAAERAAAHPAVAPAHPHLQPDYDA